MLTTDHLFDKNIRFLSPPRFFSRNTYEANKAIECSICIVLIPTCLLMNLIKAKIDYHLIIIRPKDLLESDR